MKQLVQRRPLLVYFILAYGLTWLVLLPLLMSRRGSMGFDIPEDWEALGAFGPFFAALLVARALQGRKGLSSMLRSLGRWRVGAGRAPVSRTMSRQACRIPSPLPVTFTRIPNTCSAALRESDRTISWRCRGSSGT